jgi:hypothetical protein
MPYTLTIRSGARVEHRRFDHLGAALDAIEVKGLDLERQADARPAGGILTRRIAPVQQVVARLELARGLRLRAGIDVRGDGSSEAFTGLVRRRLVDQRAGESAYDALRRSLMT